MKNNKKNNIKDKVATGFSTATGATIGVVVGSVLTPETVEAQEIVQPEYSEPLQYEDQPESKPTSTPETVYHPQPASVAQAKPDSIDATPESKEDEIQVVSYDRETNDDGSQMDVAVLSANGHRLEIYDVDLDGMADFSVSDANDNGQIDSGEVENLQGQGIAMQPYADAAGFDPLFAQNDLPDYVNDADVDSYMA